MALSDSQDQNAKKPYDHFLVYAEPIVFREIEAQREVIKGAFH
jgi:hypothetical protein